MSWPQTCLHRPPRHKQHLLCTHAASSLPAQHPRMLTSPSAERSLLPSATVPGHPDSPWHRGLCREAAAGRLGLEDCTSWHRGMLLTAGVCLGGFGMENFGGISPTHCASLINPSSLFMGTANCKFKCAITPIPILPPHPNLPHKYQALRSATSQLTSTGEPTPQKSPSSASRLSAPQNEWRRPKPPLSQLYPRLLGMLMPAPGVPGPAHSSHTRSWLPIHGARKDSQPQCCCRGLPASSPQVPLPRDCVYTAPSC